MKSARESPLNFPLMLRIDPTEADISAKLHLLSRLSPTISGGLSMMKVDQVVLPEGSVVPNLLQDGSETIYALERGFMVQVMEGTVRHDWLLSAQGAEDAVRLRISFDGQAQFSASGSSIHDERSRCTFMVQHAGSSLSATYRRGSTYRYCTLDISRTFLRDVLGLSDDDLPRMLSHQWHQHEIAFGHIVLGRGALVTAAELFNPRGTGRWQLLHVRVLALDLLRQVFETWQEGGTSTPTMVRIRGSERKALAALRSYAESECPRSIPLVEAVSMSGMNRNKLQYAFRQMFGQSLQQYCADLRMQMAHRLLESSDLSVAEIAARAGFSEPTNFSAAFRAHFSVLPSQVRRRTHADRRC